MSELARPLADAADRLFSHSAPAALAAADAGQWQQALWDASADLGPAQLLVPEDQGGAGGDWLDACTLLERAGAAGVPLPLTEAVLAGWLRARAGLGAGEPGPVALAFTAGDLSVASGQLDLDEPAVPWAVEAAHVAFVGGHAQQDARLLWLPRAACDVQTASRRVDPAGRVACKAPRGAAECRPLPGLTAADIRARAALLTAAEMAGALGRVLELSLAYTAERVQFGRAIGQFQAVQHQLAQLAEEAAAARVAVQAAAASEGTPWFVAAAATAKLRAGEAAGLAARIGHQLHGAIGVTAEHALHRSTLRLHAWRDEHGSEADWARVLVQAVRGHGVRSAWQAIVDCTSR
jgi:acyl-CoA dehydrogenase